MHEVPGQDAANLEAMTAAVAYQSAMCRLVAAKLKLGRSAGSVLDFGAGRGDYAVALKKRTSMLIVGLEPDRSLHQHFPVGMPVVAELATISPGRMSCAYSLNVLEHIADDTQALRDLAERCRPGASIFILVPANPSLWSAMDTLVGHFRRYTPETLRSAIAGAGLEIVDEGWFDRTGYAATRTFQLMQALRPSKGAQDGSITKSQVRCFDLLFRMCEPLLSVLKLPFGKNRWVLARKRR